MYYAKDKHIGRDEIADNIVILGAGLAGLSAAYHSGGVVFEKASEVGGTCRSVKVDGCYFDMGVHVLHTQNKEVINLLEDKLRNDLVIKKRIANIYYNGRFCRYPFQANLYSLPLIKRGKCLFDFLLKHNHTKTEATNYQDWVYSIFGKGISDFFYLPYSEKFWTIPAYEMGIDWIGERVPLPGRIEVLKGAIGIKNREFGPNVFFRYPHRGAISALPVSFLDKNNIKVVFNKEAKFIDTQNRYIRFSDGSTHRYRKIISTIPLPELIRILSDAPPAVKSAASDLRHNSILCVNIVVDKEHINDSHWIYYPQKEYIFFRVSFLKNFSYSNASYGMNAITAEISYSDQKNIDKNNIVDAVIQGLIESKVLNKNQRFDVVNITDVKYGYCIYDHRRVENLKTINNFLQGLSIYTAGRYGRWEYQWMDDAILDGKSVGEKVLKEGMDENSIFSPISNRRPEQ